MMQFCKRLLKIVALSFSLLALAILTLILFFYLISPNVVSLEHTNPTTTAFIELYKKQAKDKGDAPPVQWTWVSLSEISPVFIRSIIHTEDMTFWNHNGFDWNQIKRSMRIIWEQHQIITGGSTITQQVAKNLYLYPERSFLRKCREFIITQALERNLSKERILEIYLNIVELGDGVFGIEAGSQYWFNCSAKELNPNQAVSLAFALPNPHKRDPNHLSDRLMMYANMLLFKLAEEGIITDEEAVESISIPEKFLTDDPSIFPFHEDEKLKAL